MTPELPTSSTHLGALPVGLPAAAASEAAPSPDAFIDLRGELPGDLAHGQLRVMVCDPGTLYVYWTTDGWTERHYRLSCQLDDGTSWTRELPAGGRECWLSVPAGAHGVVVFEVIDAGSRLVLGRAHFEAPAGRAPMVAPKGVWRIPGAAPGVAGASESAPAAEASAASSRDDGAGALPTHAAPPPEGLGPEDVMLEGRLYHGHVWKGG